MLPSPPEILRKLQQSFVGQREAAQAVLLGIYKHLLGVAEAHRTGGGHRPKFGGHMLLIGPTGSGKTMLASLLAQHLNVPFVRFAATRLVETGYVGEQVEAPLRQLLAAAGGDVERAKRGIVFIDEIDKIRAVPEGGRDIRGFGVQAAFLTPLDGSDVIIGRDGDAVTMPTHDILFLCAGAFDGLSARVVRRLQAQHPDLEPPEDPLQHVIAEDLVDYGFIPEFVGRFTTVRSLQCLSVDQLETILTEAEGSVGDSLRSFFELHGVKLNLTPGAVRAVAERAAVTKTGARGLARVLSEVLAPIEWKLTEEGDQIEQVTVTKASVLSGVMPRLSYRQTPVDLDRLRELREVASSPPSRTKCVSDTKGWSIQRVRERTDQVLPHVLKSDTAGSARKWWEKFSKENKHKPNLLLFFLEQLWVRDATIAEFFSAHVHAAVNDITGALHYLDYRRIKLKEDAQGRMRYPDPF